MPLLISLIYRRVSDQKSTVTYSSSSYAQGRNQFSPHSAARNVLPLDQRFAAGYASAALLETPSSSSVPVPPPPPGRGCRLRGGADGRRGVGSGRSILQVHTSYQICRPLKACGCKERPQKHSAKWRPVSGKQ